MNPKNYKHPTLYMLPDSPDGSWNLGVVRCRRKWRMVYGWRNNPVKAALHFTAAAMFADCAQRGFRIAERLPIYRFRAVEAQVKGMFESAAGMAALCGKWVRVGTKHEWQWRS